MTKDKNKLKFKVGSVILGKKKQAEFEEGLAKKSGLYFNHSARVTKQDPHIMLLLKAYIVFSVIEGCMMCFMYGFGIEYNLRYMTIVALAVSLVFTLAHTRLPLTVAVYGVSTYLLSDYINKNYDVVHSGVIAIVNASYELIRQAYKLPSVDGFDEIITNHNLTISVVLIIGIVIAAMWVSLFVCRFMNLMLIVVISMLPLGMVLFFNGSLSPVGATMICTAWGFAAFVKFSSKYTRIRRGNRLNAYYLDGKVYYKQVCDGAMMLCGVATVCLGIFISTLVGNTLFGVVSLDNVMPTSKLKTDIDRTVRDTMIIAFSNYKNYKLSNYQAEGELGFYGNTTPDFETDLTVTLVPYTTDRMYLKSFIGSDYGYKKNAWTVKADDKAFFDSTVADSTANAIADEGVSAKIRVENTATSSSCYAPYYSTIDELAPYDAVYLQDDVVAGGLAVGSSVDITYHPLVDDNLCVQTSEVYRNYVYNNYRDVPEELKTRIAALCSQYGLRPDDEELDDKMAQLFQDNYKYDFKSGRLPWQTDFVEYFLFENKSGVCAHFATAATLMYRTLGIPARYVEGYCIDYENLLRGERVDGNVSDWLSGVTPLSDSAVRAELSDYNAHAWVEIYKDGVGWVTVDPTPYVDSLDIQQEEEDTSVWEELMLYFQNGKLEQEDGSELLAALSGLLSRIVRPVLCLILLVLVCFVLRPLAYALLRLYYLKNNGIKYVGCMYDYLTHLAGYCGVVTGEMSYREFFSVLGADTDVLKCTEKALYSKNGITKEELVKLSEGMKGVHKLILSRAKIIKRATAYFVVVK